ncbi:MAG: acyl-CoA dehydrogenase [candidate division NC10 bacterium]|jgi:alkylation response protein AidB-like acyl-CoA dehydrogenase|nr:acyl-CoA dehydrogenase [candidate division NC10 bacterium]MCH7897528.1 acyl-CoA dehydrogenase [candidate division NC10 bacterium]MCZ6551138.1 acyl-CoA dehydrogenase [candidate division NC10 bacterium]
MDFGLTQQQQLFQEMVREFAEKEVAPRAAEVDEEACFPAETVRMMGKLGLMGVTIPEAYGGAGADTICYAIAVEEISRACASTGVIMSINNSLVCDSIHTFGAEEQKRRLLIPLARGEKLGCYCLSEPDAGSDAANLQLTARAEGNHFLLNGVKNFITNGQEANIAIVFATVDRQLKHKGISAFLVEKGTPGFGVLKVEKKLGIRGTSCCQLLFENCRVPRENLLGGIGEGFNIAMASLDGGRIGIAAQAVGIARAAYEAALGYAKGRVQFGQPIASFQAIQFMLADMATTIDAARLLAYRAAILRDQGIQYGLEASMAKLYASEVAMCVTTKAIQIYGGYGYITDYPVQRYFRDAKVTEIYEGTSEIQRLVIAGHLVG